MAFKKVAEISIDKLEDRKTVTAILHANGYTVGPGKRKKTPTGKQLDYYLKGKEKLWFIHPKTKRDLEGLLRILNDHGEAVLISYIKNVYLKKDKALERV